MCLFILDVSLCFLLKVTTISHIISLSLLFLEHYHTVKYQFCAFLDTATRGFNEPPEPTQTAPVIELYWKSDWIALMEAALSCIQLCVASLWGNVVSLLSPSGLHLLILIQAPEEISAPFYIFLPAQMGLMRRISSTKFYTFMKSLPIQTNLSQEGDILRECFKRTYQVLSTNVVIWGNGSCYTCNPSTLSVLELNRP